MRIWCGNYIKLKGNGDYLSNSQYVEYLFTIPIYTDVSFGINYN